MLSKGHAAPILYAAWAEAGLFARDELKKVRIGTQLGTLGYEFISNASRSTSGMTLISDSLTNLTSHFEYNDNNAVDNTPGAGTGVSPVGTCSAARGWCRRPWWWSRWRRSRCGRAR